MHRRKKICLPHFGKNYQQNVTRDPGDQSSTGEDAELPIVPSQASLWRHRCLVLLAPVAHSPQPDDLVQTTPRAEGP